MPTPGSALIEGIAARGYALVRDALPGAVVAGLRERARELDAQGALTPAGVGRGGARAFDSAVRGDRIAWLADTPQGEAEARAFDLLESLRIACNRELLLSLAEFECHYASYPPGAGYQRHRDRFRDDDARVISFVLYLNENWRAEDGGTLRLFLGGDATFDVVPEGGTVVVFLSADFDHEVHPATRERIALTGWFRRRSPQRG